MPDSQLTVGMPITGVVLAGGENRRMGGRMKALLPWNGRLMIERQLEAMEKVCAEIIVVVNRSELLAPYANHAIRLVADIRPGLGPIGGMQAAFMQCSYDALWIVACDMPYISAEAAVMMAEMRAAGEYDAVVPHVQGRLHPLHGIYDRTCREQVDRLIDMGELRLTSLLDRINWHAADESLFLERGIDSRFIANINSPEEYKAYAERE